MKKDTTAQGAAAVHIVCADLLLSGYRAYVAAEGLHYDVVLDVGARLFRVQVKSTRYQRKRKQRPGCPLAYQFLTNRGHRPDIPGGKSSPKRYDASHADIIACVAIDLRAVAYLPVKGQMRTAVHLFAPGTPPFVRGGQNQRRCIDEYPIAAALTEHGYTGKPTLGWL